MSLKSSGALSGAASGAAMGAQTGNPYMIAAGAVLGGLLGWSQGSDDEDAIEAQRELAIYNATMQYNQTMRNVSSSLDLLQFNNNLSDLVAEKNGMTAIEVAEVNAAMVEAVADYNAQMYDRELERSWVALDLDLNILERERAKERGTIRAQMGASGTVIDVGSNRQILVGQKEQELLDQLVIRYNAMNKMQELLDAKARSNWEAQATAKRIRWEGRVVQQQYMQNALATKISRTGNTIYRDMGLVQSAESQFESNVISANANTEYAISSAESDYRAQTIESLGNLAVGMMKNSPTTPTVTNSKSLSISEPSGAGVPSMTGSVLGFPSSISTPPSTTGSMLHGFDSSTLLGKP